MSRERLSRAEHDLFARHPARIVRALERGDLDFYGYAIVAFFVDKLAGPYSDGEVAYTLNQLADALKWPPTREWLRDRLHRLRTAGWIDFDDIVPGQRRPWVFRLGRAAIDGDEEVRNALSSASPPTGPPSDLQVKEAPDLEVTSNRASAAVLRNPLPDGGSEPMRPPSGLSAEKRGRRETDSSSLCFEESRAASQRAREPRRPQSEPFGYDLQVALRGALSSGGNAGTEEVAAPGGAGASAHGPRPPRVVVSEFDGSFLWSGEPREGEHGVLADVAALMAAGVIEEVPDARRAHGIDPDAEEL
jgi:hypothetical protein